MPVFPQFPPHYAWVDAYLVALPGAVKEHKDSWEAVLYRLHGKIFALLLNDSRGRGLLNLKVEPYTALWFRAEYPHIEPGWHMNKLHWNSLHLGGDTPDEVVRELLDMSYALVLNKLPRRLRTLYSI